MANKENPRFIKCDHVNGWRVVPQKNRWGETIPSAFVSGYGVPDADLSKISREWYKGTYADTKCQLVYFSHSEKVAVLFSHAIAVRDMGEQIGGEFEHSFQVRLDGKQRDFWRGTVYGLGGSCLSLETQFDAIEWVERNRRIWRRIKTFEILLHLHDGNSCDPRHGEVIWKFDMARAVEMIDNCGLQLSLSKREGGTEVQYDTCSRDDLQPSP